MNGQQSLHSAPVLITGATGFIGGRLAEYLVEHYGANVRALVRRYGRAVRLARYPVQLAPGDLLNTDSLKKAVEGCEVVFHCAFGAVGEDDERRSVTVDGTRNLLEAAVAAGVKRFVHMSTISVHGADPGSVIDEQTPTPYTGDLYGDSKIDAEKLVLEYARTRGLPVVILRPTIVYGPRAGGWTVGPVARMKNGDFTLIDNGNGIANHVYVDDVVQALLLAATRPNVIGETFIISYGEGVTWRNFFSHYAQLLGIELPNLAVATINAQRQQLAQLRSPLNLGLSFAASPHAQSVAQQLPVVGPLVRLTTKALPTGLKTRVLEHATKMREIKLNPPVLPRPWIVELFCAQGICKIDKAQRMLGYQPQVSLAEGMQRTAEWLRDVRMI